MFQFAFRTERWFTVITFHWIITYIMSFYMLFEVSFTCKCFGTLVTQVILLCMDIFLCCLRLLSVLKLEEHSLHLKSWSRWSLLCSCRLLFAEKFLPQTLQIKASGEAKVLPCTDLLWSSRLLWELNFEKHIRHVNFPIKWPFLCLVRFFFIVNDFPHSSQTQEAMFQHEQWRQTDEITSCFNV